MNRWLLIAALAFPLAGLSACSSDDDEYEHRGRGNRTTVSCSANTTCGTCTPVLGCGWCSFGDGAGKCASGPEACGSSFRWNWEPVDCPVETATDAGPDVTEVGEVASSEAGAEAATDSSATSPETAIDAPAEASVCSAPATSPSGCARTTGGTLCPPTQYTLGCHAGTPAASLGCTAKTTSGTSTYYCCPCL